MTKTTTKTLKGKHSTCKETNRMTTEFLPKKKKKKWKLEDNEVISPRFKINK